LQPLRFSHLCLANSLGVGLAATLDALVSRRTGLLPCRFETVTLPTYVGEVAALDEVRMRADLQSFDCRNNRLAQLALDQDGFAGAVAQARERYGARRVGVFLGTSTSGILETELAYRRRDPETGALPADFHYATTQNTFSVAHFVQRYLGLRGPAVVVSSACATTAKVFGNAARMITAGLCDAAVVGGADSLCLTTLYGFHALGLVSSQPCRPFDVDRDGISIGEGAGFVLLERPHANEDDEAPYLLGFGESSDAYHMSTPHPEGLGAKLAMERALASAGLRPGSIDYINLHGTATRSNDAAEDLAICALFGKQTACSSTKGWTGHTLGAAGVTEAIIAALTIRHGIKPGSLHTRKLDPALHSHYLIDNEEAQVRYAITNSFGFGGSNCSLILGRAP
jgi:3-oxoacyl-[acyl-carrier-protein] synthase-1